MWRCAMNTKPVRLAEASKMFDRLISLANGYEMKKFKIQKFLIKEREPFRLK